MQQYILLSDQLLTWSAHGRHPVVCLAQASRAAAAADAFVGDAFARLAHRALQALRQTWLQMRRWTRSWAQVPVGELSRAPASNGLCATGRSRRRRRTSGELSPCPRDHRRDLRDQPRTVTPPRGALRNDGEPVVTVAHHPLHRSTSGRRTCRQHARGLAHRRVRAGTEPGGRR